jgi:phenylacetate-CoA ligase
LGEVPMNAFRAREAELAAHARTLLAHPEIEHLMAYVDSASILARFIEERKLPARRLKTIMACAGTVTEQWREILGRVFQADVLDKYGSRECADIACECAAHSGLHIYSPNVFVEVVDHAGRACPPGQTGRILITLLNNSTFPMIRYEIGDVGIAAAPGACPCGLSFPRLASIQGRQDDMLVTEEGTVLSSALIRHFVGVSLNRDLMREWQFEQTGPGAFVFRYVPMRTEGLEKNLEQILGTLRRGLGQSARVEFQQVSEIPLSATGKMRWVINRSGFGPQNYGSRMV